MIAQNLPALTLDSESPSEQESAQCSIELLFRTLLTKNKKIPLFKGLINLETRTQSTVQSIGNGKLISKKMRTKLITWLEKLSIETFEFSIETLLLAIKILDEYLCLTNESPASLQLIGSACLYLAAKSSQVVIVASQCYVVASANCFTQEQLLAKEFEIYRTLGYNTTFSSMQKVYKFIKIHHIELNLRQFSQKDMNLTFLEILKNTEFREWKDHRIVTMLIAITHAKKEIPKPAQLIDCLKSYSIN